MRKLRQRRIIMLTTLLILGYAMVFASLVFLAVFLVWAVCDRRTRKIFKATKFLK